MTVIESLHRFFLTAPVLEGQRLDIDCLQSDPDKFSLDSVPAERTLKQYMDGSTVRRQLFTISSRANYGPDLNQQKENLRIFEELESWIDQQIMSGVLPYLGEESRTARSLRISSTAYPMEANEGQGGGTARYQMQFELIYLQNIEYQEDPIK